MKTAIIGSGVSGLVAAYALRNHCDLTVYEADSRLGGHANTVKIEQSPSPLHIDTGFIVHNDRNYPLLTKLFSELGVDTQDSNMSFSVSAPDSNVHYRATNLSSIFAHRPNLSNTKFLKMLVEIQRFNSAGRRYLSKNSERMTTEEFCAELTLSQFFLDHYLIPLGASIWSSDPKTFLEFPANSLLRFLDNHGLLSLGNRPQWKTIVGGSHRYVNEIASRIEASGSEILLNSKVTNLEREANKVRLTSTAGTHSYDKVIVASHSDQALEMVKDPTSLEKSLLEAIQYQSNKATLHTDTKLLPANFKNWAAWNYRVDPKNPALPTLTYDLTLLQQLPTKRRYLVSLNSDHAIDENRIITQTSYAHPVYNLEALAAQDRYEELISGATRTNTYFVGAYWHYGFHEDGAKSATQVVSHILDNLKPQIPER